MVATIVISNLQGVLIALFLLAAIVATTFGLAYLERRDEERLQARRNDPRRRETCNCPDPACVAYRNARAARDALGRASRSRSAS